MPMRMTGMYSGLDTETIISELVKAKSVKVDKLNKDKTKSEWKTEAWTDLNKKIKSFYSKTVSEMRFNSSYSKKTTSVSNSSAVSVITGAEAMDGVQTLSISSLAKSGYLTGGKMAAATGNEVKKTTILSNLAKPKNSENLSDITGKASFTVKTGDKTTRIELEATNTVEEVVSKLKEAGVMANFDEKNQRIFVGAKESGSKEDFIITADNAAGFSALSRLGLNANFSRNVDDNDPLYKEYTTFAGWEDKLKFKTDEETGEQVFDKEATLSEISKDVTSDVYKYLKELKGDANDFNDALDALKDKIEISKTALAAGATEFSEEAVKINGQDCKITLNGASFTSNTNTIQVNGLTFTCLAEASDVTITTQQDTSGIYDMIRDFFKEYNEIMNEMDKLYNADAAKDYEPLTDEEKEKMTDTEIEKWEKKIKDALLRKDDTLGNLRTNIQNIFLQGFDVSGKKMYLTNFGIETLSYFTAPDNEKHAYHIDGDDKDDNTATKDDKLKAMIAADPDAVTSFFSQLSRTLYTKLGDLSKATDYSSAGVFWEDKKAKSDMTSLEEKIKEAEKKLAAYEDKYYDKFSKMEVALSKLESSTSSLTSMLGQ
ncbi:MAG: flagellar filament capping protein FliD [Lachnospiraceae bacterium]|nr:flagellar filament capping protein FliD [Lachnospiraceae bacterium]